MRGAYDLLAYDVNAHIYKGVQVKALSKRNPVRLGNTLDKFMGDWWIIVTNAGTSSLVTNPCRTVMSSMMSKLAAMRSGLSTTTVVTGTCRVS